MTKGGRVPHVPPDLDVLARIARWAETRPDVRAVLLTSSRARPGAPVDALSDWDIILYAGDPDALLADPLWPDELGPVLVRLPPAGLEAAWPHPSRLVVYEDGPKIDFMVKPVSELGDVARSGTLPAELDAGYRVLLDRDGLTRGLPAPTGAAYVLAPPSQADFGAAVEEFWWESLYVAKSLWRGELLPARYSLDCVMRQDLLLRMLQWRAAADARAADADARYRPGVNGRGLRERLDPELWTALERTFAGPGIDESWRALDAAVTLFRDLATSLARDLRHAYPHAMDERVTARLEVMRPPRDPE